VDVLPFGKFWRYLFQDEPKIAYGERQGSPSRWAGANVHVRCEGAREHLIKDGSGAVIVGQGNAAVEQSRLV